ncbi:MAG: SUMF1/EgtB/PvdO family nonheme iron enzyme [Proteobacteria bacterium]|nr:SUMF1/EgtB/PvdO family nonheme iron enzyme [Pseudomonadota bacterium]
MIGGNRRGIAVLVVAACWIAGATAAKNAENWLPQSIEIPEGEFINGSDRSEREAAYRLDEAAYGHSATRKQRWYENEFRRQKKSMGRYFITRTPITNTQYEAFVIETGHPAPDVDRKTWQGYGLIHPWGRTRRHAWVTGKPPKGRDKHPVVLVSYHDAQKYAAWLSAKSGQNWRLPTEEEWEKAARGVDGFWFPWGNKFDAKLLNSHDGGPFDTVPVGRYLAGRSPFGLLDGAGQVFEWTSASAGKNRRQVKGGSWDDKGCGVCRPASRHGRPEFIKHILVGFRLVKEPK